MIREPRATERPGARATPVEPGGIEVRAVGEVEKVLRAPRLQGGPLPPAPVVATGARAAPDMLRRTRRRRGGGGAAEPLGAIRGHGERVVGVRRFELRASSSRTTRSAKLSYTPAVCRARRPGRGRRWNRPLSAALTGERA